MCIRHLANGPWAWCLRLRLRSPCLVSRLEAWNVLSFYRAVLYGHAWKSLILCSTEESRLYEFGTTWGSENEQFFLFDWRVPLNMHDIGVTWWLWVVVFNKNPGKLSEIKRKKNDKHVRICPWMPSSVHSHVHAQIKETVSSHKWIHLSQWSMRTAGDGSGGIQSRAEARGSLKATNLSYVVHAAIQTQHHSGVRNKQNGKKKAISILESYTHIPLTPIWCSDKLLFEIQWNAPQEKNERMTGEWEVGKTRIRHMCLWHLGTLLWCCVYVSVACDSIWRHGPLSAFGFF